MTDFLEYNNIIQTVKTNKGIAIEEMCNAVTIINVGTTLCTVQGIPLNPGTPGTNNGESFTFGGNKGEIFRGRLDIGFATSAGNAIVIQKIYIHVNDK